MSLETRPRWLLRLAVPVAAAGAAATGLLYLPGTAAADTTTFQAETMTLPAGGHVVTDSAAVGSQAAELSQNGTATKSVGTTGTTSQVTVRARGGLCSGSPIAAVSVNGKEIGRVTVSTSSYANYMVAASVPAGTLKIGVAFVNDYYAKGVCDRNLFVDEVGLATSTTTTTSPSPSPSPTSTGTSTNTTGQVLFDSDFAHKGITAYANAIHPERISVVDDPVLGAARKVVKMTVYNTDTGPTSNPRAQLETPKFLNINGGDYWIGYSVLFPNDWPASTPCGTSSWVTIEEVYGPPYAGGSPRHFGQRGCSADLDWQRMSSYNWDVPWQTPINRMHWTDVVVHTVLSQNSSVGLVELWTNPGTGWQKVTFFPGSSKATTSLHMATVDGTNNGGANYDAIKLYRQVNMWNVASIYFADHKIGTSFSAVSPHTYG